MILVWGFRGYTKLLGVLTFVCAHCHNPAAQRVSESIRKFTFFWIPLFVVKRQTVITCAFCGSESVVPREHTEQLMADLAAGRVQQPAPRGHEALPQDQTPPLH